LLCTTVQAQENPAKVSAISVAPRTLNLQPCETYHFQALQGRDGSTAQVDWFVNEALAGNAVLGMITPDGVYTAPSGNGSKCGCPADGADAERCKLPADLLVIPISSVVVTAALKADHEISGSTTVVLSKSCDQDSGLCVQVSRAIDPFVPAASFLVTLGETLQLRAREVRAGSVSTGAVTWKINGTPNGDETVGTLKPGALGGQEVTYEPPRKAPAAGITVTASVDGISRDVAIMVVAREFSARCPSPGAPGSVRCKVKDFDRLEGETGAIFDVATNETKKVDGKTDPGEVTAINASRALFSGSLLEFDLGDRVNSRNCRNYDWKMVVQAKESAAIFIYSPGDVGPGVCEGDKFIVALPVHIVWAEIYAFKQPLDPSRSAPLRPGSYTDCLGQNAPQTIVPCDRNSAWTAVFYKTRWIYRHITPPGTAQGTISMTPVVGKGTRQLSFDVQLDPSFKIGPGWFNAPLVFEKSTNRGSNLDALIFGTAYDLRFLENPDWWETAGFVLRKPQLQARTSVEIAPTTPHDANVVEGETVRLPLVFNLHEQPSVLTIYPLIGAEEGSHLATHIPEHEAILRGLAGVEGSMRFPFIFTHNFLGNTPITLDYSYRVRWLANEELLTDVGNNGPEILSKRRRSYFRTSLKAPLNPYLQFSATLLRGSLPPDFRIVTTTLSLGLTFTNPGSSEH
jgi:hypothetical protein